MRSQIFLAIVLFTAAVPAHSQYPDVNPKLKNGQAVITGALVLPPQMQFTRHSLKGPEGMTPEADKLAETLSSALSQELSARGVKLLAGPAQPTSDSEKYAFADLQTKFDNLYILLRRNPDDIEKGRYSLGDSVSTFVPAKGADALVFLRGNATESTAARHVLSPLAALPELRMDVTFADAKTGEILAWVPVQLWHNMTKDQTERLAKTFRHALHDIPLPVKPAK